MRRIAVVVLAALVLVAASPTSAWAATLATRGTLELKGTFSGSTLTQPNGTCPDGLGHLDLRGDFKLKRRHEHNGRYTIVTCVGLPANNGDVPIGGTFVVRSGRRVTLRGIATGTTRLGDDSIPINLTLTVTSSSGERHPVRGTITAVTSRSGIADGEHTGSLVAELQFAKS
jgi:hypothetical protein